MNEYQDSLNELNKNTTLSGKLTSAHSVLRERHPFIDRIAVAIYDRKTDSLKTFVHSSGRADPLTHYEAKLSQTGSLQEILRSGRPRVINDLDVFNEGQHEHTKRIAAQGYGASYTMPMYLHGVLFGFVFFDSYRKHCFQPDVLRDLDLFGHLISLVIINELSTFRTMLATVRAARDIAYYRDMETGAHLDRIAHYSRLIAKALAPRHHFDDEFIEHIFVFSPLHDIGKIGVPDAILKKPGRLIGQEQNTMKEHALRGRQMIDAILREFGLDRLDRVDILRNIAEYHHEAINGRGYPHGLKGAEIPIEARIIAVADIFDALTSRRRYKEAWTTDEAFAMLRELAGIKLDQECVEALINNREEVENIRLQFQEAP